MSALTLIAYLLLSAGPGLAFFGVFIAPKSLLVLLSLFSTFLWLIVLLLTAALFRGFLPIGESTWSYSGMLMASVMVQEIVRYGVWQLHKKSMVLLDDMAVKNDSRFAVIDKLYLALAWGYGHGACHVLFFYLSLLPLAAGGGTFYSDVCPHMSFFLVGAISALAFSMILPSIMVVSLDGYSTGNWMHICYAPVMHLTAAAVSLGNLLPGGCMFVPPILLVLAISSMVMAALVSWHKGATSSSPTRARLVVGPAP